VGLCVIVFLVADEHNKILKYEMCLNLRRGKEEKMMEMTVYSAIREWRLPLTSMFFGHRLLCKG